MKKWPEVFLVLEGLSACFQISPRKTVHTVSHSCKFQFPHLVQLLFLLFSCCHAQLLVTPWTAARRASLSFTVSGSLLKLMPIESVVPSNHLVLCHPLPSCPQSFPASGSFPTSWHFASGGQNIGASASSPVLPMSTEGWFPLGLADLISLQSTGLLLMVQISYGCIFRV